MGLPPQHTPPPIEDDKNYNPAISVTPNTINVITNDQLRALVRSYWDVRYKMTELAAEVERITLHLNEQNSILAKLVDDEERLGSLLDTLDPKWEVD